MHLSGCTALQSSRLGREDSPIQVSNDRYEPALTSPDETSSDACVSSRAAHSEQPCCSPANAGPPGVAYEGRIRRSGPAKRHKVIGTTSSRAPSAPPARARSSGARKQHSISWDGGAPRKGGARGASPCARGVSYEAASPSRTPSRNAGGRSRRAVQNWARACVRHFMSARRRTPRGAAS